MMGSSGSKSALSIACSRGMPSAAAPSVDFRSRKIDAFMVGALDIGLSSRRIISVPTQIGCLTGCTFCISSTAPLRRNLSSDEISTLVEDCLIAAPPDGRPIELSFTGEGESLVNWKATARVCRDDLPGLSGDFDAVRFCSSGFAISDLLDKQDPGAYPARLQVSLHAARQCVRDRLVPRSSSLDEIREALDRSGDRFSAVELNVVLQGGINDRDIDLAALCVWGNARWPILLNPLLQDGSAVVASRTDAFERGLEQAGRVVKRYEKIAQAIGRMRIYPLMSVAAKPGR